MHTGETGRDSVLNVLKMILGYKKRIKKNKEMGVHSIFVIPLEIFDIIRGRYDSSIKGITGIKSGLCGAVPDFCGENQARILPSVEMVYTCHGRNFPLAFIYGCILDSAAAWNFRARW